MITAIQSSFGKPEKRAEAPVMESLNTSVDRCSRQWPAAMEAFERCREPAPERAAERSREHQMPWAPRPHSQSTEPNLGYSDPRHPDNPNNDLYNELQRRIPDASEDRLLQFTAACHENLINAKNLSEIRLDEERGSLTFIGTGFHATPAKIDLDKAPPAPEQAIAQIQQHDRQEAQILEAVQMQQAQMSMGRSL